MKAVQLLPPGTDRTDRDRWLEVRRSGIGGSDVSAILGMHPYKCARDIWEEKLGIVPQEEASKAASEAALWGTLFEPTVRDEWSRRTGIQVEPLGIHRSLEFEHMLTSVDGLTSDGGLCEVKTTSQWKQDEWGDDQLPDHAELQVTHNMVALGLTHAWVAGLIGGQRLVWRRVELDPELAQEIIAAEREFWTYVDLGVAPKLEGTDAAVEHISRRHPTAEIGRTVEVDAIIARQIRLAYRAAKAEEKRDDRQEVELKNLVRSLLGDAELLVDPSGNPVASWKNNGTAFDEALFREEHPDLAEEFTVQVPQLDRKALAAKHPTIYPKYRNRVLRIKG